MKIIQEITENFKTEDNTKKRQIVVLSDDTTYIVLKLDNDKSWNDTDSKSVRAFMFDDENKVNLWVSKLRKDIYM